MSFAKRPLRTRIVLTVICALLPHVFWGGVANAEITFEFVPLKISGLPQHRFSVVRWTKMNFDDKGQQDLVIAGSWLNPEGKDRSGVLVVKRSDQGLKVVHRLFEMPSVEWEGTVTDVSKGTTEVTKEYQCWIYQLQKADLDNDGHEEIIALGRGESCNRIASWKDGQIVETPVPSAIPAESSNVIWFDYNADGFTDLLVIGGWRKYMDVRGVIRKPQVHATQRLYRNVGGILEATDIGRDLPDINSMHVIDFDQDGKPDLCIGEETHTYEESAQLRIYLNRGDKLEPIPASLLHEQLMVFEQLDRVDRAVVVECDFDGDGLRDLLISGYLNSRLQDKSHVSFIYRKRFDEVEQAYYLEYDRERTMQIPDILLERFIVKDLDGDGDEDLMAIGRGGKDRHFEIACLENRKDSLHRIVLPEAQLKKVLGKFWLDYVIPMDVNSDGLLDFICLPWELWGDSSKQIMLLLNTSKKVLRPKDRSNDSPE